MRQVLERERRAEQCRLFCTMIVVGIPIAALSGIGFIFVSMLRPNQMPSEIAEIAAPAIFASNWFLASSFIFLIYKFGKAEVEVSALITLAILAHVALQTGMGALFFSPNPVAGLDTANGAINGLICSGISFGVTAGFTLVGCLLSFLCSLVDRYRHRSDWEALRDDQEQSQRHV